MENMRDLIIITGGILWIFLIAGACLVLFELYRNARNLARITRQLIKDARETSTDLKQVVENLNDLKVRFK